MRSITFYLDNPQTKTLAEKYGAQLQKMQPETKLNLINIVSSASLRRLSIPKTERLQDDLLEGLWARNEYVQAINIIRDLPTDRETAAKFIRAIAQNIS